MRLLQQLLCRKEKHHDDEDPPESKMKKGSVITQLIELDMDNLLQNLIHRHKVRQAAIMDLQGNNLHFTPGFDLFPDDCLNIQKMMTSAQTTAMWKFSFYGEDFKCFFCDGKSTVLGYSPLTIMAAHVTHKHIVVGLAPVNVPGSCLHEMMVVWKEMESQGQ